MIFKIINMGPKGTFSTSKGLISINETIEIADHQIAKELEQQGLKLKLLDKPEWPEPELFDQGISDFSDLRIQDLRSIASKVGINGFFKMKKSSLINELEKRLS